LDCGTVAIPRSNFFRSARNFAAQSRPILASTCLVQQTISCWRSRRYHRCSRSSMASFLANARAGGQCRALSSIDNRRSPCSFSFLSSTALSRTGAISMLVQASKPIARRHLQIQPGAVCGPGARLRLGTRLPPMNLAKCSCCSLLDLKGSHR